MKEQNETNSSEGIDELLSNPFGKTGENESSNNTDHQRDKPRKVMDTLPEESRQKAIKLANQIDPSDSQSIIT